MMIPSTEILVFQERLRILPRAAPLVRAALLNPNLQPVRQSLRREPHPLQGTFRGSFSETGSLSTHGYPTIQSKIELCVPRALPPKNKAY